MKKDLPLWHRITFSPEYTERVRLMTYDEIPPPELQEKAAPQGDRDHAVAESG